MNNHDCNKIGFIDRADAVEFAKWVRIINKSNKGRNSKKAKSKVRLYLCGRCHQWHSTTISKSEIKRKRAFKK